MAIPFDYSAEYKRKLCTPDEAARVVKSGDWIDISPSDSPLVRSNLP